MAEAAWIAVAGGLIAEFTLQEPSLSIGALALFVLAGVLAAHFLAPAAGDRWPSIALFLVALGGLLGWLSSPAALATLQAQGVFPALAVNVAGWVGGLAVLRGYAHAQAAGLGGRRSRRSSASACRASRSRPSPAG